MMTEQQVGRATRLETGRRPKVQERGRVCAEDSCETKLSIYNKSDRCSLHRPVHYPRSRR